MRFLFFAFISVFISRNTYAQAWVDVGLKGQYGISQLINSNTWNDPNVVNHISPMGGFGGKIGLNFNLHYQFTVDFMWSKSQQKYEVNKENPLNPQYKLIDDQTVRWNSFDLPLLFRHNSDQGSYFEIGPMFTFYGKFNNEYVGVKTDVTGFFKRSTTGAVIGMGSFMLGSDNLYLVFGGRVFVGFSDIITTKGGSGSIESFPNTLNGVKSEYDSYKSTIPVFFALNMEVNYDLGYLVRSNCKRTAIRFF